MSDKLQFMFVSCSIIANKLSFTLLVTVYAGSTLAEDLAVLLYTLLYGTRFSVKLHDLNVAYIVLDS